MIATAKEELVARITMAITDGPVGQQHCDLARAVVSLIQDRTPEELATITTEVIKLDLKYPRGR